MRLVKRHCCVDRGELRFWERKDLGAWDDSTLCSGFVLGDAGFDYFFQERVGERLV
jgi:hypothetical protein